MFLSPFTSYFSPMCLKSRGVKGRGRHLATWRVGPHARTILPSLPHAHTWPMPSARLLQYSWFCVPATMQCNCKHRNQSSSHGEWDSEHFTKRMGHGFHVSCVCPWECRERTSQTSWALLGESSQMCSQGTLGARLFLCAPGFLGQSFTVLWDMAPRRSSGICIHVRDQT